MNNTTTPVRLADRILADDSPPIHPRLTSDTSDGMYAENTREERRLREVLRTSPIFVADNVAEYVVELARRAGGTTDLSPADEIPNLAPPFHRFFIEMQTPRGAQSRSDLLPRSWGFTAEACEPNWDAVRAHLEERPSAPAIEDRALLGRLARLLNLLPGVEFPAKFEWPPNWKPTARWALELKMCVETNQFTVYPACSWLLCIEPDGRLLRGGMTMSWLDGPDPSRSTIFSEAGLPYAMAYSALLTIAFLHTRNVEVLDNEPPQKLSRARQRKGKPALLRYHTLQIEPMKQVLRREGNVESEGLTRALHITRGHFKTFSGKGLFGRHKGTFWWGDQARGSAAEGVVTKDYSVGAPADVQSNAQPVAAGNSGSAR